MRRGAGNIIYQSLGGPNSGQKGSILFLEYFFFFVGMQRSCDGGRARSAPFGAIMSPKRRVRAAHGRARAATTH